MKIFGSLTISLLFFSYTVIAQSSKKSYNDFDRGYYLYYYSNKPDSAFLKFAAYVSTARDSLQKATAYSYMGEILWNIGDYYGAQENLLNAVRILNPGVPEHREELGYTYNLLGNVSLDLKHYDEAITFYNSSLEFLAGEEYALEVMNGKATALQKAAKYRGAIRLYDSLLSQTPADKLLLARIIDNRAWTKWKAFHSLAVGEEFKEALKIRVDSQFAAGMTISYSHLSDYFADINSDSALCYANKMRLAAIQNQSGEDLLEALDRLIRLSNSAGAKGEFYNEYKDLRDSLQHLNDTTRNRFALIRYDVQRNKEENLILQQDNLRQRVWLLASLIIASLFIFAIIIRYNKRRKSLVAEAKTAINESKLRTSKKVHDVVANGLYSIMNELEHTPMIQRDRIISNIERLYEKSRDISYDTELHDQDFSHNQTIAMLLSFGNATTKVLLVGFEQMTEAELTSAQQHELHLILREIMVNMTKHSSATNVVIHFKNENNQAVINYKDDGIGFTPGRTFGRGLSSTVSRITALKGEINFDTNANAGLKVIIRVPHAY